MRARYLALALLLPLVACATPVDDGTAAYCRQAAVEIDAAAKNWPNLTAAQQQAAIRKRDESRARCQPR